MPTHKVIHTCFVHPSKVFFLIPLPPVVPLLFILLEPLNMRRGLLLTQRPGGWGEALIAKQRQWTGRARPSHCAQDTESWAGISLAAYSPGTMFTFRLLLQCHPGSTLPLHRHLPVGRAVSKPGHLYLGAARSRLCFLQVCVSPVTLGSFPWSPEKFSQCFQRGNGWDTDNFWWPTTGCSF